ncbi:lysozyme [Cohnella thailandensis]|uniref:Lysozyme n=1 Tax=Cohnella thailandensis TaxID=557557 RepID=A0A841SPI9_9BACL|nr:lysozyme [Cohnella thailandensis]MBB6633874.1 lysozyme [Cohnella thailandensis]MBP1972557.1 GH24 family phage-related lysozyme (muramidase) [Cohnella thailandensis]
MAYKPVAAETYWTIGWGHYGADVKQGMTITQAEAEAMLVKDLDKYEAYVNNSAYVPVAAQLTQNQFDTLVSFCYNCGAGNLKTLCAGRTAAEIAASIPKYKGQRPSLSRSGET